MKHVVFLVGSYHPQFSAVGTCCFNIAEEIAKHNKVTVICLASRVDQPLAEEYQGQIIVRVSHRWWDARLTLAEKMRDADGMTKELYRILLNGVRARDRLSIMFSRLSVKKDLVHAYLTALGNLEEPPDVVVPFCRPFESICAAIDYKKQMKEVKLIPYLFDRIVESKKPQRSGAYIMQKGRQQLALEERIIDSATGVMVVNSQEEHFRTHFADDLDCIHFIEHPLIKQVYVENSQYMPSGSLEKCALVYTGSFVKGYVSPDYMLSVLFLARKELDFALHLYGGGSGYRTIHQWQSQMPDTVVYHGHVDKSIAMSAIARADILVNVAENRGLQMSSKVFEYMSAGKPIVHFYTAEQDVNIGVLRDYPLCLCLKQENALLEENAKKLVSFIENQRNSSLVFEEVETLYHNATPRVVANQMMEIINGCQSGDRWDKEL